MSLPKPGRTSSSCRCATECSTPLYVVGLEENVDHESDLPCSQHRESFLVLHLSDLNYALELRVRDLHKAMLQFGNPTCKLHSCEAES